MNIFTLMVMSQLDGHPQDPSENLLLIFLSSVLNLGTQKVRRTTFNIRVMNVHALNSKFWKSPCPLGNTLASRAFLAFR